MSDRYQMTICFHCGEYSVVPVQGRRTVSSFQELEWLDAPDEPGLWVRRTPEFAIGETLYVVKFVELQGRLVPSREAGSSYIYPGSGAAFFPDGHLWARVPVANPIERTVLDQLRVTLGEHVAPNANDAELADAMVQVVSDRLDAEAALDTAKSEVDSLRTMLQAERQRSYAHNDNGPQARLRDLRKLDKWGRPL